MVDPKPRGKLTPGGESQKEEVWEGYSLGHFIVEARRASIFSAKWVVRPCWREAEGERSFSRGALSQEGLKLSWEEWKRE